MSAQTQAASSTAEVADVFQGQQPTLAEYSSYRDKGEVPERFKPTEPPEKTDAPEETAEPDEPESEPEEAQELPQKPISPAEKRIKQLLAENKELKRRQETAKPTQTDSSTAQAQPPQNYEEWRKSFKPSEFVAKYGEQNPDATYEDAQAAMFDYLGGAKAHFRAIEDRVNAEKQALDSKVEEARNRYTNFDEIKTEFLAKVISDKGVPLIPLPVLSIINDSDHLADLLYTIGSDDAEMTKFVAMAKSSPNKAIRYVAKVESLIAEELAKPATARGEDGKFKAPETKKTSAPKPPSPVGGGSSRAFDVNDESLSADEWFRKRNAEVAKRG